LSILKKPGLLRTCWLIAARIGLAPKLFASNGHGQMFKTVAEITSSSLTNSGHLLFKVRTKDQSRQTFSMLVAVSSDRQVVRQIALQQLAEIAKACNVEKFNDTDELHGREFVINYDERGIKSFDAIFRNVYVERIVSKPTIWTKLRERFAKRNEEEF
jgi:hypothetical protein